MKFKKGWTLALAGAMGFVASAIQAQGLTLDEAVRRSLADNAALRAEGAAVAAVRHQAAADGLAPPLTIGTEVENVAGTGDVSGIHSAETTLRLGRVFELGGKQSARRALGEAQVARQLNLVEQRRLDVAADVAYRFIEVVSKQARLALAEQALTLAQASRKAVAQRVERGRSPQADLHLADLAVIRAELEREAAGNELASARVTLSVLWGQQQPDFERASGELEALPAIPPFETLVERLPHSPDQQAFALESQQIAAQTRVAEASRRPDLQTTLGVRRLEAIDDQALVLSFSLPLGMSARSSSALAKQQAEGERVEAQRSVTALDAYQSLFGRYQSLQRARHEFETMRERMVPIAEKALASTEAGYEEARFSFLQVAQARTVLLGLQRDVIDAATRYHRLLADIERATAVSGDLNP